jgi:hypothetical protein
MLRHDLFVIVLLICFAKAALRLYPMSVLGFMHMTCYSFVRDALMISTLFALGWLVAIALPSQNDFPQTPENSG